MALTSKGLAYLVIAYLFIGLALAFREPAITVFVIPNAILLFFSARKPPTKRPRISLTRSANPARSFGGESIDVNVEIRNDSTENVEQLQLKEQIPDSLKLESGSDGLTIDLKSGETIELWYRLSAPKRGVYMLGPMSFRTTDILGFHEHTDEIQVLDELTVLPRMEKLGPIELRARRVEPWPGLVPSRRIGVGTDFFELRDYSPGDDLRRINWKASAKLGHLITNEFEGEQVTDVLVVVDCSEGTQSKLFDYDAAELEVAFAASLCAQLIQQGNRVGLSVYSTVRTWVDPGFGKRHLLRLLNNLAIVTPGKATLPMQYAVESVISSVVPARSIIVFISPLMGEVVDVIANLAARGYGIICFTPTAGSNPEAMSESMILARRILSAERRMKLVDIGKVARLFELSPKMDVRGEMRRGKTWGRT